MGRENRTGLYELTIDPELEDLFRVAMRQTKLAIRTHTVCSVVAYNAATKRVDVSVDILQVVRNNVSTPTPQNPNPTTVQEPVILRGLPIAWPGTSQGFLTFPITPGLKGELHVQDRSLEAWLSLEKATDPVAAWTHNLSDSVFHPTMIAPSGAPFMDPAATVLEGESLVKIGAGAVDFVALATKVLAELQKIQTWANTHTHTYNPGPLAAAQTAPGTPPLTAPSSVAATKAQAE